MLRASIPPPQVPLVGPNGLINPDWYQAFVGILKRTGGSGSDLIATALQATATGVVVSTDPTNGSTVERSLAAGTGLSISNADGTAGNPSYSLANTAVSASSYGDSTHVAAFTVDAQGRLTAASSVAVSYPVASVFGRTGAVVAVDADYNFAKIGAGTATNDNASAGRVGEYVESVVLEASAAGATSGAAYDVTSISLTAGDWDVEGNLVSVPDTTTTTSDIAGGISTASATLPDPAYRSQNDANIPAGQRVSANLPRRRLSLAGTTTVYLVGRMSFAVSTNALCGFINARRVR